MNGRRLLLLVAIAAILVYRAGLAYCVYLGPATRPSEDAQSAILNFAVHAWVPLLSLIAGAFVGLLRPHDGHALRAAFMFLSFSLVFSPERELLGAGWARAADVVGSFASVVALPLAVLLFFFQYPERSKLDARLPWLKYVFPIGGAAILLLLMLPRLDFLLGEDHVARLVALLQPEALEQTLSRVLFVWIGAHYALAMSALGMSWGQASTPDEKRRLKLLHLGASAGTLPLFAIVLAQRLGRELPVALTALLVLTLGLFPLSFVYVVVKHRVFGIRLILRRGLQYALVSRGFLFLEALLLAYVMYAAVRHFMRGGRELEGSAPLMTAGLTLGLALALPQLNRRVFPVIDRRFFRDAYDAHQLLVELSRAVRRLASKPGELLETVKRCIQASLHPRFVTVLLKDPRWSTLAPEADHPLLAAGVDGAPLEVAGRAAQAALLVSRIAAQAGDPEPRPVSFRVPQGKQAGSEGLLVPIASGGGVLGFLALGEKLSEEPYSKEDRALLTTVAEQTAVALENALLFREVADQERLRREVEIARDVQGQLFPKVFPPLGSLRYCGSCRPARAVGGDYYDFIALGRSRLGIALGDIAGKGISAALLMTSLHAMLRSHALLGSDDLGRLVADINRLLYEATDEARYATFFYGVYEAESRRLSYVNAGHIPPILVRPEDPTGVSHRLCEGGPVIGLLPEPLYTPGSITFQPGDVLVVVSDGVSEAENPQGDMFGEERVAQLAAEHAHASETAIHDRIVEDVTRFRAGAPQGDDMTLIVAKVS